MISVLLKSMYFCKNVLNAVKYACFQTVKNGPKMLRSKFHTYFIWKGIWRMSKYTYAELYHGTTRLDLGFLKAMLKEL